MGTTRVYAVDAPIIGVAGGIGSGKSAVARQLATEGCIVSNADDEVRTLLRRPDVRDELVNWWGDRILDPDGAIDRRAVADIVFNNDAERKRLEAYLHPRVSEQRRTRWEAIEAGKADTADAETPADGSTSVVAFVIDAPLLFEAGLDHECDAVIFVHADREVRLTRVRENRGWDSAELDRREQAQWPLDLKRERADHTIVN
ncbi:MAG: dephospho-CoA kinase, partial [Planctomycetota bacterium]